MWLIPVLWPIDLINLPRRGPRPVLKPESKLTLKVLDDFGIPTPMENAVRTPALVSRITPDEPTYQSMREQAPAPVQRRQFQPTQQSYTPPAARASTCACPVCSAAAANGLPICRCAAEWSMYNRLRHAWCMCSRLRQGWFMGIRLMDTVLTMKS